MNSQVIFKLAIRVILSCLQFILFNVVVIHFNGFGIIQKLLNYHFITEMKKDFD